MVHKFGVIKRTEIEIDDYERAYNDYGPLVRSFFEMEDDAAVAIETEVTRVRDVPAYRVLQSAALRRGFGIRSAYDEDKHMLYVWRIKAKAKRRSK